ncbi:peptide ABC transporter substrate-binding protein [Treponema sp. OMZ 840]|uniref:peptide ABC transporter substrate-binding protein n=1 Tax=Treponema sp. OMZ 840 TaxID=244313 RepID=UPI003D94A956
MYKKAKPLFYAGALPLFLCFFTPNNLFPQTNFNPAVQKELVIIDSVHAYNLNPHKANYSSEAQILNGLYEGLFSYDPLTLEPVPAAVKTFRISRDQKKWTFILRDDIYFSNGEPIEAQDFKRSWLTLLNPKTKAPFASLLDCIKGAALYRNGKGQAEEVGIQVKDAKTLTVYMNTPTKHFSKILCHHAFAVTHTDKNVFSGAFIVKAQGTAMLLLEKNPFYFDAENVAIPSIRIINSSDKNENTLAFNTGEAPWISGFLNTEKIYDKEHVLVYPQFGTEFFFFKASQYPWNIPLMRKAVLSAIPWEKLRQNNLVPAETLILPLENYPHIYGITDYDTDEAKLLLAEALAFDSSAKNKKKPVLKLAVPDFEYVKKQAFLICDSLKDIGIDVTIETADPARYLESIRESTADLFIYTWIGDFADPLAFLELFRGGSSLRETEWHSDYFDALLEKAALTDDAKERYKKLAEAEQFLLDDGIVLPVSHPVSLNAVDTGVLGGWFSNSLNIHPFKYLYFKEASEPEGFI